MEQYDVFISYRRGNASDARIFQQFLEGKGLRVFLDVDSLGSGHFDKQILQHIDQCIDFLFIASPGSLDRCMNEGDWVRLEIAHALKTKKNVIPVLMEKFEWPKSIEDLPEEIRELQKNNAFTYSHIHWKIIQDKLIGHLTSTDFKSPDWDWAEIIRREPDDRIVTDKKLFKAILDTKYPWHVRAKKSGIEMLLVPSGEYKMGAVNTDEQATDAEKPDHRVQITKPFYLSQSQVTQAEYKQVMQGRCNSLFRGGNNDNPVENLSFTKCMKFVKRGGFRLPTEAEWEYACKAGLEDKPRYGEPDQIAWYKKNSNNSTSPVRTKTANPLGFYDMLGNVAEWCKDYYLSSAYETWDPCDIARDPETTDEEFVREKLGLAYNEQDQKSDLRRNEEAPVEIDCLERTIRGGSYSDGEECCRASSRRGWKEDVDTPTVGFRVAKDIHDSSKK
jgi:formylglycine-generating enzyme required for sulfatase activity